jgi:hypothetical protein
MAPSSRVDETRAKWQCDGVAGFLEIESNGAIPHGGASFLDAGFLDAEALDIALNHAAELPPNPHVAAERHFFKILMRFPSWPPLDDDGQPRQMQIELRGQDLSLGFLDGAQARLASPHPPWHAYRHL